jgi:aminopeptidase N
MAETNPVAKNDYVANLGIARDPKVASRALDLLSDDKLTVPQKARLLAVLGSQHPDLAFDWAVAHQSLVDSFIETSNRASFVVSLGRGSRDPAMPGKILAYAQKNLPAESQGPAQRVVALMAASRATRERLTPEIAAWLGVPAS